jgi:hypothetical protein
VEGEALLLLLTAALYHDIGFVEGASEHETSGARIAVEILRLAGRQEASAPRRGEQAAGGPGIAGVSAVTTAARAS